MKIISISTDKKIFDESSAVRQRMFDYGTITDSLHIIVLSRKLKDGGERKNFRISDKVFIYPTNSLNKFRYSSDAKKIAFRLDNIDLVTAQDPYETGWIAWRIAKKIRAKLELQIHTDIFNPYFIKHSLPNRIRSKVAKFLLHKADHLRVVSKRIKLSLPDKLQEKTTILPIFVSPTFIQFAEPDFDLKQRYPQFKFIMVMMNRLEKEKNVSMALGALAKVVRVFPKTGLIILGEGSLKKALKRQAIRLGLEENVIFNQWTNNPITYYKTADLFLATSDYEGYGMSLVEAILSHCPILTTKVGIVGEVLSSNNAFLCDVGDRECFSLNMIKAQQHPELLREFQQKAYVDCLKKIPQTEGEILETLHTSWSETIIG